jgi:uncharacterized Tic20 family protein
MAKKSSRSDENVLGMLAHLLGLLVSFVGPLVMYLVLKDSPKARENAKHSLNFQISLIIYSIICMVLMLVLIGFALIFALGVFELVVVIIACMRAYEGGVYTYPLEIQFIK